jgi:fatty-acyl-CoA synthase
MQPTMMRYELTLTSLFRRAGELYAGTEIVSRNPDKSIDRKTYADFDRRARMLASALRRAGMNKGDRVATLCWNHHAHLEAYFGIPVAGGVLHTLNLRLHPDEIAFIAAHARDRFIIVDSVLWPLFEKVRAKAHFEKVIVVRSADQPLPGGAVDYEAFIATGDPGDPLPALSEDDALGVCYTSGTTGKPKGVCYSHRAIALHSLAAGLADTLSVSRRDTVLPVVPMFHANAWGLPFACVMVGAKLVLPGPHLGAADLLDLFERERVTMAAGVPTIWLGILQALDAEPARYALTRDMRMVVGGAAAPESMIRGFDKHGLRVVHAWGMTETAPLGTVSNLGPDADAWSDDERYAQRAKQGIASPFIELRAMSDRGPVPRDGTTPGELEVRGAWVAASYVEPCDESAEKWTDDGWFRTGDVVTLDASGCVKITDRTKDLIKSGGEWISSVDVENLIIGHPAVKEAAVIAVPHPKWDERPLAAVVVKEGATVTAEALRAFVAAKLAKYQVPDAFVFIDAIPKTSTGKFQKSELRERFKNHVW